MKLAAFGEARLEGATPAFAGPWRPWGPSAGKLSPMGSIGRYMFRTTMGAFVITLVSLTIVMWFTQAIREFDLITSQRQTLFVFIGITGLLIPLLIMMIAPISLVLAVAHVLNKLSSDSEIIVMNAAGVSPWRLVRPFIAAALVVSAPGLRDRRLSVASQPARTARLGHAGSRRHSHQHRAARTLHHGGRQSYVSHRRPATERTPARHIPRRPARPEGTRHLSRRAGRDREERHRLIPGARKRQRSASRSRPAAIRAS